MQEICSSNPPVVTGICDPNKSQAQHHHSLKLGSKLKYLKIQLTMAINFMSSTDSDKTGAMYTKSNNVEIMMVSETDEITEDLFDSFLQKYQEGLEESTRGSEFAYDSVDALYYNLNKIR